MSKNEEVKRIKAINPNNKLCYKCLKERHDTYIINIDSCGYGSAFDNFRTYIQLCEECFDESQKDKPIWNMDIVYGTMSNEYIHHDKSVEFVEELIDQRYKYDNEISKYLSELPLESQELVYNRFADGALSLRMKPQDWIDFHLGILSHEKCKKYGLYSPEVKAAYSERFPICQYPVHIIYNDGSQGCHCPFGAFGNYENGEVVANNLSNKCYKCKYYKERIGTILTIHDKDMPDYNLYIEYKLNKDRLEQKFSELLKGVV